jgi:hypothetical protein
VDSDIAPQPDETPESSPDADTDAGPPGQDILATGTGGCAGCAIGGGREAIPLAWLVIGALALLGLGVRRRDGLGLLVVAAAAAGIALAGCNEVPYCIGDCTGGADAGDVADDHAGADGETDGAEDTVDAAPDSTDALEEYDGPTECYPECEDYQECCMGPEGPECVDLSSHLNHCGECGNRCELPNAYNACEEGVCVITGCDINFYDCIEDDPSDITTMGCETVCFRTLAVDDVCDDYDNDCDCVVDDDIDFTTDPENCGDCGVDCRYAHADGICSSPDGTAGSAVCSMGACHAGYHDLNADDSDGCEYECTACEYTSGACVDARTCCTSTGDETCNGLDDECDGDVDEGNPEGGVSCGSDTGECVFGTLNCRSGVLVCEGGTGPTQEICNGLDDDCDGSSDEPNSGETYLPDEDVVCGSSTGDCEFGLTRCVGGSLDCEGDVGPVGEVCDGHDNDCNGTPDDGSMPGEGVSCGTDEGVCTFGTTDCVAGSMVCVGGTTGTAETCNGLDDDCDGSVDEDFFFDWDPSHCGNCTTDCSTLFSAHALYVCASGTCTVVGCDIDWWPVPGDPACDSSPSSCCTYNCTYTGTEVCDGLDNDCDTLVDGADTDMATVADFCEDYGECAGAVPVCTTKCSRTDWFCDYRSTVSVNPSDCTSLDPEPGAVTPTCDDLDNDCDGDVDEHFPTKGDECHRGDGACRNYGTMVCNSSGSGVDCSVTAGTGSPEVCNNIDDDCDTVEDDFVYPADFATVGAVNVGGIWILQHEAARPDATTCDMGTELRDTGTGALESPACAKAGVQPWVNITWDEARLACQNLGGSWDLCTASQWQHICETASNWAYPYGNTYVETTCNGNDLDTNCPCCSTPTFPNSSFPTTTPPDDDEILDTGTMTSCTSTWGSIHVYDMSGNVKEWTRTSEWVDLDGDTVVDTDETFYEIRGGASNQHAEGLKCDFDFTLAQPDFLFMNLGFRCCHP